MNTSPLDKTALEAVRHRLTELKDTWARPKSAAMEALTVLKEDVVALKDRGMSDKHIARTITEAGIQVSYETIRQFLKQIGYRRRRSGKPATRPKLRETRSAVTSLSGQTSDSGPTKPIPSGEENQESAFKKANRKI